MYQTTDLATGGDTATTPSTRPRAEVSAGHGRTARITGLAYLGIIITGIFAEFVVRGRLVTDGDAIATATDIANSTGVFGLGIGADMMMILLDVTVGVGLFVLLRRLDRRLAIAAMFFRLVQAGVLAVNLRNLTDALGHARDAVGADGTVSTEPARQALAAVEAHALGYDTGLIAFGLSCLVLGHVLRTHGVVRRWLAIAMSVTGVVYLTGSAAAHLAPDLSAAVEPFYLIAFVTELAFAIVLLRNTVQLDGSPVVDLSAVPTDPAAGFAAAEAPTMRAVVQDRYGSADVLRLDTIERPEIGDDEVLVRVVAAGVDRGTWHLMTGQPLPTRLAFGITRPRNPVPGLELAGIVEAVGRDVTRFAEGDHVFGVGTGTYADYARAREAKLAAVPAGLDLTDLGAIAVSGSAALQAVEDHGRTTPGMTVLVLGASGGVGSHAAQIAQALGAEVTGVAGTDKLDLVRGLGIDTVIDHRASDPLDGRERYDLIIDTGGNRSLRDLRRALTPTGTLVIVGGEGGGKILGGLDRQLRAVVWSLFSRQRLTTFVAAEDTAHLERLVGLVEAGHVRPVIDRRFPLHRAADAMRHLESGQVRGKAVIEVGLPA